MDDSKGQKVMRALSPEPIFCKGFLGFWNVSSEIEKQIKEQIGLW
jgi:hypothetical protein